MTTPLSLSLAGRDFLGISDLASAEADAILDRAVELRADPKQPLASLLDGQKGKRQFTGPEAWLDVSREKKA